MQAMVRFSQTARVSGESGSYLSPMGDPADRVSRRVTRSVVLPLSEVKLRVSRSSGPGGQHANTSETRVEAVFDVEASAALTENQKRRVVARAGPTLRAIAQDERSQARNRELAIDRLVARLAAALRVERKRVPTRPSRAATEKRLDAKKRRGATKRLRRVDDGE
jgi:ribosome-associated protein